MLLALASTQVKRSLSWWAFLVTFHGVFSCLSVAFSTGVIVWELGIANIKLSRISSDASFLLVGFSILVSQRMVGLRSMRPGLNYYQYWVLGKFLDTHTQ